jgi:4-hydroxythreonine-4-phosphate dehydrogenase
MLFRVTMGDSCGIGPEVLLKAFGAGQLGHPVVVCGNLDVLEFYDASLGYGVGLHRISRPAECRAGGLNVIDHGIMRGAELTIGRVNARSGRSAREYVVAATRAALAGEIAAIVTLPVNREATQLGDPGFVGHTELIGALL